jgi:hypothetical protein
MSQIVSCSWYNGVEFVCIRSKQPISELLLWDHTKLVNCKFAKGASNANYSRLLLKAIERVDGLFNSDGEVRKLMLAWRSRIKMIVAANKEEDSSKREERKIRCIKTRRAIVVI